MRREKENRMDIWKKIYIIRMKEKVKRESNEAELIITERKEKKYEQRVNRAFIKQERRNKNNKRNEGMVDNQVVNVYYIMEIYFYLSIYLCKGS